MDKLFTTQSCTQCQALKGQLNLRGITLEIIDAELEPLKAVENGVMQVPTIVTEDGEKFVGGGEGMRYINERHGGGSL